jgi:hypothetical protein
VDNDYRSNSIQSSPSMSSPSMSSPSMSSPSMSSPRSATYLSRPEPRESINEQMRRFREEKRASQPPPKPALTFESEYHFPELGNPQYKPEIKLPESKQKEMIVNAVILPIKKKTLTVYSFDKGKVITKDIYEDGTDAIESGVIMIKKPNYTSWASVLKEEKNEIVYYDKEESLFDTTDKSIEKI